MSSFVFFFLLLLLFWGGGGWRTCRRLSFRIKGSRTHLVGWNAAGPLALITEIILPLMTPTYSEISLLKLVLADYLQVLELHLFAILQMWKTLMPGRGSASGEKSILIPGITTAASVNRPREAVLHPHRNWALSRPPRVTFICTDATICRLVWKQVAAPGGRGRQNSLRAAANMSH